MLASGARVSRGSEAAMGWRQASQIEREREEKKWLGLGYVFLTYLTYLAEFIPPKGSFYQT